MDEQQTWVSSTQFHPAPHVHPPGSNRGRPRVPPAGPAASATQSPPRVSPARLGYHTTRGRSAPRGDRARQPASGAAEGESLSSITSHLGAPRRGEEEAEGRQESPRPAPPAPPQSVRLPRRRAHMPTAYSLRAPPSAAQQRLRLPLPQPPPPLPFSPAGGGAARRRRAVGVAAASASPFDELHARGRPVRGPSKVSLRLPRGHRPNDQPLFFLPKLNSSWLAVVSNTTA